MCNNFNVQISIQGKCKSVKINEKIAAFNKIAANKEVLQRFSKGKINWIKTTKIV